MDEIDAIGGRRFSEGTSADREIQRTLMELLNQLDGFDQLGKVICLFPNFRMNEFCATFKVDEGALWVVPLRKIFIKAMMYAGQDDYGNKSA